MDNITNCNLNNEEALREVMVKIGLERVDTQEGVTVEALLDSGAIGLVISSEFARRQGFKLKKIEKLIYVRNVDGTLNKKGPIEHTVEVNIYYQGYRERTEIDVIGGQKWNVILEMLWLVCHNPEINWRTGEIKITRCLEKCGRQWRLKQGEVRVAETKEGRKKRVRGEEIGGRRSKKETGEEKLEKKESDRYKLSDRRVGNLG